MGEVQIQFRDAVMDEDARTRELRMAGRRAYAQGDVAVAQQAYDALVDYLAPDREFEATFVLAVFNWMAGEDERVVLEGLEASIRCDPSHPAPYLLALAVHAKSKASPEAVPPLAEALLRAAMQYKFSPLKGIKRALWAYVEMGRFTDARALIEVAVELYPDEASKYQVSLMHIDMQEKQAHDDCSSDAGSESASRHSPQQSARSAGPSAEAAAARAVEEAAVAAGDAAVAAAAANAEAEADALDKARSIHALIEAEGLGDDGLSAEEEIEASEALGALAAHAPADALAPLGRLAAAYPRSAGLYRLLGTAYTEMGDVEAGRERLEYADKLARGTDGKVVNELLVNLRASSAADAAPRVVALLRREVLNRRMTPHAGSLARFVLDDEPALVAPTVNAESALAVVDGALEVETVVGSADLELLRERVVAAHVGREVAAAHAARTAGKPQAALGHLRRGLEIGGDDVGILAHAAAPFEPEPVIALLDVLETVWLARVHGDVVDAELPLHPETEAVEVIVAHARKLSGTDSVLVVAQTGEWAFVAARAAAALERLAKRALKTELEEWARLVEGVTIGIGLASGQDAYMDGKFEEALQAFGTILSKAPRHAKASFWSAVVAQQMGSSAAADAHYARLCEVSGGPVYEALLEAVADSMTKEAYMRVSRNLRKLHDRHHLTAMMQTESPFKGSREAKELQRVRRGVGRAVVDRVLDDGQTRFY
ncbi:uncharacterized protein AMSG_08034 [Thecamonas trahens ATCC 50062]|uniref:Tetratricopeptide repeat protein n=1 Tax=Thecamonas trahens ATCC 50062 TaxID=461836 RepID=A0A0L0DJI8_THETB|nr:hypothetical protein AMSG_08034 [Thecamonas trahens ATCC 50062]KNC52477.1 hypothetical protein AMSG_08034 [Thecamonas trahens ATCC 50062]|eukprot:XP_013755277.1 hypothetical protein AMSG_08034 [Thecamonas trahens ATCC 50062]